MTDLHPAFDWHEVARLAMTSRMIDELEEQKLTPQGLVSYQFSARGHELGQILISQLLDHPFDAASVYYRSRPLALGSGLTVEEAFASGMARLGGLSAGRDTGVVFNMPRRDRALILPMAGDVGSGYTPAAGWAQGITYRVNQLGEDSYAGSIAVVFGGDGSVASNGFWSALTIATTLKLPLLFVIEDNGYAISVTGPAQTPGGNIAENLASFKHLEIWSGSGTQPAETSRLAWEAVNYVRKHEGPALLRLEVPRLSGHTFTDNQAYKTEAIKKDEWSRDPLVTLRDYLVPDLMDEEDWLNLAARTKAEIAEAAERAQAQPQPDVSTVQQYAFYEPGQPQIVGGLVPESIQMPVGDDTPRPPSPARINMIEAIRRTLDVELALNPRCVVFGEDVGEKGGVHAATLGLQTTYGPDRVFDTSLSEEGIIGRAAGLAYAGLLPVPEIQFRKYADPATEQIHNCGTLRWRTNNRFAAPMVIRMPVGYRKIGDPWHSVSDEIMFAHAVGWRVAIPSNAEDTVGLLRSALRGNDPVIFFEHRYVLDASWARRPYPGDEFVIPFGQARFLSTGDDLTVVTWGAMAERCEAAMQQLDASIELIDLRTLVPWDKEAVLESVMKTAKCLVVHEDIGFGGFGGEIVAAIVEEVFMYLDAPVERVAAPSVPVPFNTGLMDGVVPTVDLIRQRMVDLLEF